MWKEIIFLRILKCKLQYLHARQTEFVAKLDNRIIDLTKIFGDNRKMITEGCFKLCKEVYTRCFHPFTVDGGFFAIRDRPIFIETTEMVDSQEITECQLVTDTVQPPLITGLGMLLPVI